MARGGRLFFVFVEGVFYEHYYIKLHGMLKFCLLYLRFSGEFVFCIAVVGKSRLGVLVHRRRDWWV